MSHEGHASSHEGEKLRDHLQGQLGADIQLLEILGANGAELLVRARHLDRNVVLKILAVDRALAPEAHEQLEREVAIAAQLLHRNIVPVEPIERRGTLTYYTMDLGRARTLESLMGPPRSLDFVQTRDVLRDVATALDYAHGRGIVHGALSPTEIFVANGSVGLVSGFGLIGGPRATRRTGAPAYMAPEQWQAGSVIGERADQYALGVIAFELVTGQRRTTSSSIPGVVTVDPLPLAAGRPLGADIPVAMTAAILRAISKRPVNRFDSCREFIAALSGHSLSPVQSLPTQRPSIVEDRRNRFAVGKTVMVVLLGVFLGILAVPSAREAFTGPILRGHFPWEVHFPSMPARVLSAPQSGAAGGAGASRPGSPNASGLTIGPSSPAISGRGSASPAPSTRAPLGPTTASPRLGHVRVTLRKGSATVFIDGLPRGTTPLLVRVSPGAHTVSLVGPGSYAPARMTIRVAAGDTAVAGFSPAPPSP
jgi:serine/threonine protein kinase